MGTDIMHAYLGLAALATIGGSEDGLSEFDSMLCVSRKARGNLQRISWWRN
jgi:prenyltransferase beta subunit